MNFEPNFTLLKIFKKEMNILDVKENDFKRLL